MQARFSIVMILLWRNCRFSTNFVNISYCCERTIFFYKLCKYFNRAAPFSFIRFVILLHKKEYLTIIKQLHRKKFGFLILLSINGGECSNNFFKEPSVNIRKNPKIWNICTNFKMAYYKISNDWNYLFNSDCLLATNLPNFRIPDHIF